MTDFWRQQRIDRISHPDRPGFSVHAVEYPSGAYFLHVRGQFLMTYQAEAVLDLTDPSNPDHSFFSPHVVVDDFTGSDSPLFVSGIRAWNYTGPEALPGLVAKRQTRAWKRVADGTIPADADQTITQGQCTVALHYVVTGEKTWMPLGGPAHAPSAAPSPSPREWGSGSPVVAVVDTGLDLSSATARQEEDENNVWILDRDADADTLYATLPDGGRTPELAAEAGHGTFITSVVERMAGGLVPVVNVRALEPDGFGTEASVLAALDRLVKRWPGIPVVNMSFGAYTDPTDYSVLDDDVKDAQPPNSPPLALGPWLSTYIDSQRDTVFVAAAGNCGQPTTPFWPAAIDGVIAVASLAPDLTKSLFSNYGAWVDVCTVGEDIVGDYPTGEYPISATRSESLSGGARWSGTSFAAPIFAAEVARLCAVPPAPGKPPKKGPEVADHLIRDLQHHDGPPGCGVLWDPVRWVGIDPRTPLP